MNRIVAAFVALLILPSTAFAASTSWDYAGGLLQPLNGQRTAEVRVPYLTATSTATSTLPNLTATNLGLIGKLFDGAGSPGTNGYVLQSTGSGVVFVATSTLGLGGGGSGTVTSVALTAPTGLTVTGSPITEDGTLAVSLTAGYVIPLTASTTEWAQAYASTTALSDTYIRALFSATSPLAYSAGVFSITANGITSTQLADDITLSTLTVTNATATSATSTNQHIAGDLSFNSVVGNSWDDFCTAITGSAALCDGDDATGAGGSGSNWTIESGGLRTSTTTDYAKAANFIGTSTATSTFAGVVGIGTTTPTVGFAPGITMGLNKNLILSTDRDTDNFRGNIQFFNTTGESKSGLEWYDDEGDSIAWLVAHDTNPLGVPGDHHHIEIETADLAGLKQGRFTVGYDCDYDCLATFNQTEVQINRNSGQTNGNLLFNGGGQIRNTGVMQIIPNNALNTKGFRISTSTDNDITIDVTSGTELEIAEAIRVTGSATIVGAGTFNDNDGTDNETMLTVGDSNDLDNLIVHGSVGVGTTSPEAELDVWGDASGKILTLFSNTGTKFMEMLNTGITTLLGTWDFSNATVKQHVYKCFSWPPGPGMATTTTATTTIWLGPRIITETWNAVRAQSNAVSSVGFRPTDGTNHMNFGLSTSTAASTTLSQNNVLTGGTDSAYVEIGPMTNGNISICADITQN